MKLLTEFFFLNNPNLIYILTGIMLLNGSAAIVGCFIFLKKQSLISDALSHSILPGICLAFIISGTKNSIFLTLGAFTTGWISLFLINIIHKKSKIKEDAAIAIILSIFFGTGVVLLTIIQQSGNPNQVGLHSFLFGKAASLLKKDIIIFIFISIAIVFSIIIFFNELFIITFDRNFAISIGMPIKHLEFLITLLVIFSVISGIQTVGIVLMSSIMITPPATARLWTDDLKKMIILSAVLAILSGIIGSFISYTILGIPTGPCIVVVISIISIFSFIFSPKKGILFKKIKKYKNKNEILLENILKILCELGEKDNSFFKGRKEDELSKKKHISIKKIKFGLFLLSTRGLVEKKSNK